MEEFVPLLNDTWIGIFLWVFSIVGIASIIWFFTYIKTNKEKKLEISLRILLLGAISSAIAIQLYFLRARVGIIA
ncbi:MAG: hypothetical protein INQ03_14945 [Candidatus Heimdallarchaeota archaeon]|nr:hypothetical protein [Candidatus Heimdallarchaeota archaeon]